MSDASPSEHTTEVAAADASPSAHTTEVAAADGFGAYPSPSHRSTTWLTADRT